eukprot:485153_1
MAISMKESGEMIKNMDKVSIFISNLEMYMMEVGKDDKINGYGKITYATGGYYQGQWVNEKAQGQGQCLFPNGDFYEGEWKNNKRDGYGTYKYSNGTLKKGQWRNDTLVQEY